MFLKLRQGLRGEHREGGAATVEFALCLIPLLLIVAGVVDYGESWYLQSALATASREGARYATRYQTDPQTGQRLTPDSLDPSIQDYVLKTDQENNGKGGYGLRISLPSDANPTVPTPTGAGYSTGTAGAVVSVTVTAEKHWLFLNHLIPGLTNPQPLKSVTTMACE